MEKFISCMLAVAMAVSMLVPLPASAQETPVANSVANTVNATDQRVVDNVKVDVKRVNDNKIMYTNTNLSTVITNLEPGEYSLTIKSVPKGYFIIQADNQIEVTQKGDEQPFAIAIATTETIIKVVDKDTGEEIQGAKGNLINESGKTAFPDSVTFPVQTGADQALAPGSYDVQLDSVPNGYIIPTTPPSIHVNEETGQQNFRVSLGHTKINIKAFNDATDKELTDVKFDLLNSKGSKVVSNAKLPFNTTTSNDAAYVEPGKYTVHVTSVPDGYVIPEDLNISVAQKEAEQNFEVRLQKTSITIKAQDKASKEELTSNVNVTVFNEEGEIIKADTPLRSVMNYIGKGTYKLHVTRVPDGYALPADKTITVKATSEKQNFVIDIDFTKVSITAVDKKTGNPVSVVRATLLNNNSHEIWANQSLTKTSDHLVHGAYKVKVLSVPDGYLIPSAKDINVKQTADKQTFKVELDFTKAVFGAVDKDTGKALGEVVATIYDPVGKAVVRNATLEYAKTHLAPGKYTIRVTKVPNGYATPADKTVTLDAKASEQKFNIKLERTHVKVHYRDKETDKYIKHNISMHFENSDGRAVAIFNTKDGWKQIDKIKPGTYKAIFDVVPNAYKKPATTKISVKDTATLQEYVFKLELKHQILLAKIKSGDKKQTISWNKIAGADGYDVYLVRCGKNFKKPITTIKGNKTFSFTKKGLKNHKEYKAKVVAWRYVNGKKKVMYTSPLIHSIVKDTMGNKTNAKAVSLKSKKKITLKRKKTSTMKVSVSKVKSNKKLFYENHCAKVRYYSSNPAIASVNNKGKIKAKRVGTCIIYALAPNGVKAATNVTVK